MFSWIIRGNTDLLEDLRRGVSMEFFCQDKIRAAIHIKASMLPFIHKGTISMVILPLIHDQINVRFYKH